MYTDSTVATKKENKLISANEVYEDIVVDLTISSNIEDICDLLFELYSRKKSIKFKTFECLEIGGYYEILGEKLNIKSIHQELNGIYEVEAV